MDNSTLTTERLILRHCTPADATFIVGLVNSPGWLRYIGDRHIRTPEQAIDYLEAGPMQSYRQHRYGLYCVERRADHTPIGLCGLLKRESLLHPDIGFAFLPDFTGKGYALEAAGAVVHQAFATFGIPVLLAITLPDNTASISLLEKIGMHYVEPFQQSGETLCLYRRLNTLPDRT